MPNSVEHLVFGGGPAGSMLALRLAAAGRNVTVLEKEKEAHHKVCGEFLSQEAIEYLNQIRVDPVQLGAASIRYVRLHAGHKVSEEKLPFTAMSLSRRVLDEVLLTKAALAGCDVQRGVFVDRLHRTGHHWLVGIRGQESIEAKTVFLATGKHDLNGHERGRGTQHDLIGFKIHWRLAGTQTEQIRGAMELFLFRHGYGGLALVGEDTANLCLVVRRDRLRRVGGWSALLQSISDEVPGLRDRLQDATPCWTKPLAISPIPYGYLSGAADGIWRVGDQAAVIPSFTGDGMSIALHSAALASQMFLDGKTADQYAGCLRKQLRTGMKFASTLSRMMVTPAGRAFAPTLVSLLPGTLSSIASFTRVPERSLLRREPRIDGSARRREAHVG
jgi:flavin-dependent dehydrogenase